MSKKSKLKVIAKIEGEAYELIWEAAITGAWRNVKEWLQRDPGLIKAAGEVTLEGESRPFIMSLLHVAVTINPDVEFIEYLLSAGADVRAVCINWDDSLERSYHTPTVLHLAAQYNPNIEVLECLISANTNVNAQDYDGRIPLEVADTEEKKHLLRQAMTAK